MSKTIHLTDNTYFWTPKENEKEIKELFSKFEWGISFEVDGDKLLLSKNEYHVISSKFWYTALTLLKDNGFSFDYYVQKRYAWYENEKLKEEKEEQKRKERQVQIEKEKSESEKPKFENGWLCNKWGCLINISSCFDCQFKIRFGCKPEKVKIKVS
jgi:hypothetical protein